MQHEGGEEKLKPAFASVLFAFLKGLLGIYIFENIFLRVLKHIQGKKQNILLERLRQAQSQLSRRLNPSMCDPQMGKKRQLAASAVQGEPSCLASRSLNTSFRKASEAPQNTSRLVSLG